MGAQEIDLAGLAELVLARPAGQRVIVAVAGPPGSGKSHQADALCEAVNRAAPGRAAVLPMDGYHYDDAVLHQLGRHARKGAPDTFDVDGLRVMLSRLRENREAAIAVPVFDRALEISRAAGRMIPQSADVIVVEGNYLLLREAPWSGLAPFFDITVLVQVPETVLRARLRARWEGFGLSEAQILTKLDVVDLPNGRFVMAQSAMPDFLWPN